MILELWVAQSCTTSSASESQDGERMGRQDVSKEKAGNFASHLSSFGTRTKSIFANSDPTSVLSLKFWWGCLFYLFCISV